MALSAFNISYLNILKLSVNIYLEQIIMNYHSAGLVREVILILVWPIFLMLQHHQ